MKTTQPKKRGRPVGSTKAKALDKAIDAHNKKSFEGAWRDPETGEKTWDEQWNNIPDAQATVEQVKSWVKFSIKNGSALLSTDGYVIVKNINSYVEEGRLYVEGKQPTNYWKYACVAILLGIVTAMILATPTIINLLDVCSQ